MLQVEAVRPEGFEPLPQNTGVTQKREQGGTESGTVVEDSRLVQMLQAFTSLTDDERDLLAELLQKMGQDKASSACSTSVRWSTKSF